MSLLSGAREDSHTLPPLGSSPVMMANSAVMEELIMWLRVAAAEQGGDWLQAQVAAVIQES